MISTFFDDGKVTHRVVNKLFKRHVLSILTHIAYAFQMSSNFRKFLLKDWEGKGMKRWWKRGGDKEMWENSNEKSKKSYNFASA